MIVKCANARMECLAVEIDMTRASVEPVALEQLLALGRIHDEQLLLDPDCTQTGIRGQRHPFCPST